MSKNLKHVKLFEQFSNERDNMLPLNSEPSAYSENISDAVPEYIAKEGDFVVLHWIEYPSVGFLNNETAFELLVKNWNATGEYMGDRDPEPVKVYLKDGDSYVLVTADEESSIGITQEELDADPTRTTYIGSTKYRIFTGNENNVNETVFAIPADSNITLSVVNDGQFIMQNLADISDFSDEIE